jgi:hypothetical protein
MAFDKTHWFQSLNGQKIIVDQPDFAVVDIRDIAGSLSKLCRWGGHCYDFYSIAEHGIRLSRLMPPDLKMVALLKDAPKAYVGELQRPTKRLPQMEGWRDLRDRWALAIGTAFKLGQGIRFPPALVREYDERLTHAERRDLLLPGDGRELANLAIARCVEPITPMAPAEAASLFVSCFEAYKPVTVFEGIDP